MSRYFVWGRWYYSKPNSSLRYDSGSDSDTEFEKDDKKIDQSAAISPKENSSNSNIPSKESSHPKAIDPKTKPKIRKNLNL